MNVNDIIKFKCEDCDVADWIHICCNFFKCRWCGTMFELNVKPEELIGLDTGEFCRKEA